MANSLASCRVLKAIICHYCVIFVIFNFCFDNFTAIIPSSHTHTPLTTIVNSSTLFFLLLSDRGSCVMGQCACTEGWQGKACECPKSNQTCLDSKGVSRANNFCLYIRLSCHRTCQSVPDCVFICTRVSAMGEVHVCAAAVSVQCPLVSRWLQPVSQISRCVDVTYKYAFSTTLKISIIPENVHIYALSFLVLVSVSVRVSCLGPVGSVRGYKELCPVSGLEEREKGLWCVPL